VGYVIVTVIFGVACVGLGMWQLNRRAEAVAEITRIQNNFDAAPISLSELVPRLDLEDPDLTWHPVIVTGTYLVEDQVLVRNRSSEQGPGFEILTPLLMTDGSVFVVDRGWIDKNETGDGPAAIPEPPEGEVSVTARLRGTEGSVPGQSATGNLVPTIDLSVLSERWDVPLYTGMYGDLISETPSGPAGAPPAKPSMSEGNHLSYAFQWMAFAVLGVVALIWGVRREQKIRQGSAAEPASTKPRRSRNSDIDSATEDQLVDDWRSRG
jgi:cytochrome oxidase assembly protein ShyY1